MRKQDMNDILHGNDEAAIDPAVPPLEGAHQLDGFEQQSYSENAGN